MLKITSLTKKFGDHAAVDNLSLTIEKGDIYGFIGSNGAGKTTTIKCIVGIHGFDAGEITIDGHSVTKEPLLCKSILAYIPDNPDIYEHLTGIQYLNFMADMYGVNAADRTARIEEYAGRFEITENLGDLISSYSHGMKQKLVLCGAFIHKPKVLILDEPFVGLDPKAALTLKTIMREECAHGCAIFFSTHVLDVAEKLCTKVAIIKGGHLIASGDMETLTRDKSLEDVFMDLAAKDE